MLKITPKLGRFRDDVGRIETLTTDEIVVRLLRDGDGLVTELVREHGADPEQIATRIESAAEDIVRVQRGRELLRHAEGYAAVLGHTFTGSAHLLLAALDDPRTAAVGALREIGIARETALPMIRKRFGAEG